jgi:hypothetical protein
MRNPIRVTLALALGLLMMAGSKAAFAHVFVYADIMKEKDVTELVDIAITKTIDVTVNYNEDLSGDAEAHTVINQENNNNYVSGSTDVNTDNPDATLPGPGSAGELNYDIELDALIQDSISGNSGIIGVNQDVGNMVNQVNAVSLGETVSADSVTESQSHAEQNNTYNTSIQYERLTDTEGNILTADDLPIDPASVDPDKTANILNSINNNSGIVGVNQNAGNNNNQANGVALAVGFGSHVALAEADLGQVNAHNTLVSFETVHTNTIQDSINGNTGVVTVNQTTGNNNNQGSTISFSALTTTIDVTVPGTGS